MERKTSQKEAIQNVFQQADRPLNIEEILFLGRRRVASLNQATVYRNLKILLKNGWLTSVHHPTLGQLYEQSGKDHHHHFHCHHCNHLYCLSGCPLPHIHRDDGFIVEDHELFLSGVCPSCSSEQKSKV